MTENDFFILIRKEMAEIRNVPAESITTKTAFPEDRDFQTEFIFRMFDYNVTREMLARMKTAGKLAAALALNASSASA
jgi:hypothetical protein